MKPDLLSSRWRAEGLTAGFIFLIAALVFTWPLLLHIGEAIPSGSELPAVATFQLFSAEWTGTALDQGISYWNAPFFYPFRGVFAWCETQPFSSVVVWLLAKLTGYILAYNIVVILYLAGFGLSGYATARFLTRDRTAALWCGIWLTAGAYCLQQICSLPLTAAVFPAACIFFIFLAFRRREPRFFWLAVCMYTLTWLTCKQIAGFLTLLLPVTLAPVFLLRGWRRSDFLRGIMAAVVVSCVVLPYSLIQLSYAHTMGFQRLQSDTKAVLKINNLLMPAYGHWLTTHILGWKAYSWDIGIIPLFVILAAIFSGILRSPEPDKCRRSIQAGLLLMIAASLTLGFGRHGLYSLFYKILPGLNLVRSPARFGMFAILGVAVLSAWCFAYTRSRINLSRTRRIFTAAIFLLLFLEMWTMPVGLVFPGREIREHSGVINWLREHAGGQPVLELSRYSGKITLDTEIEAQAMMRMLHHQDPVINGFGSFRPTAYKQLKKAMADDPAGQGARYLDAFGARFVVVHNHALQPKQQKTLAQALGENIVYADSGHTIFLLPPKSEAPDLRQVLPINCAFPEGIPREGKIYAVSLLKPIDKAILITPQDYLRIGFNWMDETGQHKTKTIRMLGSVLLDSRDTRLYFRILRLPKNNQEAEALLLAAEDLP